MPIIGEEFTTSADLNEKLCYGRAWPLPKLLRPTPLPENRYEVVIVGGGPAGIFLTLQLARYGVDENALLCIDAKDDIVKVGYADGINARNVEVLRTFGLEGEIERDGNPLFEFVTYSSTDEDPPRLERQMISSLAEHPARYPGLTCLHQGRIESILKKDLSRYHFKGIQYGTNLISVKLDEASDPDFPIVAQLEGKGGVRSIRTKYLIGADGTHSKVRKSFDIDFVGDVTGTVWGILELVADTDFPDQRRASAFDGRIKAVSIPRERTSDGNFITRICVDMSENDTRKLVDATDKLTINPDAKGQPKRSKEIQKNRSAVTKDLILKKIQDLFCQYRFDIKEGTKPIWWATTIVAQRVATTNLMDDAKQLPRIFLSGDSWHTHTPHQAQGMNLAFQDSYNLAWKLAYVLFNLTPNPQGLLHTYKVERMPEGQRVVHNDKEMNEGEIAETMRTANDTERIFGCGIENPPSMIIAKERKGDEDFPVKGTSYLEGNLRTGRRLLNVKVKRFADSITRDVHDELVSNGRYRIIVICSNDFPRKGGRSLAAVVGACSTALKFVEGMVELLVLQPDMKPKWHWTDMPLCIKEQAEMKLYCADQGVYDTYGVDIDRGAVSVLRPDGIVSVVESLEGMERADTVLRQVLVTRSGLTPK